ncbi:transcriptional regulator with XRE-family HTH domain [Rhodoligotrophos appendicifer]|uniref:helix-turn-helix domain-containing protein n=1 Tax=Rhodoligotrophos appendicifer TaxID=987056 RepID=UPI001479546A|nr:XRE family transcriptional regulator [Rhodoligotrophos appendicifer]
MTDDVSRTGRQDPYPVRMITSIGAEIRQVRRSKNLTIETIAERIDRSIAHVSKLERGLAEPSLRDLYALSEALEVPVGWFLNQRNPGAAEETGLIERNGSHRLYKQGGITTEVLSPVLGTGVEVMRSVFEPSASTPKRRSAHKKREDGYLLSGKLELFIDGKKFLLNAGDSYSYTTDSVHFCRNPDRDPAVLLWVTSDVKRG